MQKVRYASVLALCVLSVLALFISMQYFRAPVAIDRTDVVETKVSMQGIVTNIDTERMKLTVQGSTESKIFDIIPETRILETKQISIASTTLVLDVQNEISLEDLTLNTTVHVESATSSENAVFSIAILRLSESVMKTETPIKQQVITGQITDISLDKNLLTYEVVPPYDEATTTKTLDYSAVRMYTVDDLDRVHITHARRLASAESMSIGDTIMVISRFPQPLAESVVHELQPAEVVVITNPPSYESM